MAGVQAAEMMVKLLTQRFGTPQGTVLELQGDLRTNVAVLRRDGFYSVMENYPQIDIISETKDWQANQFASATQAVIAEVDIDGGFVHADGIAIPVIVPFSTNLTRRFREEKMGIFSSPAWGAALQVYKQFAMVIPTRFQVCHYSILGS